MNLFNRRSSRTNVTKPVEPVKEERSMLTEISNPIYGTLQFSSYSDYTSSKALKLSTVYRCVNLISDSIASLPMYPYEYKGNWKYVNENDNLYNLLNVQPNPYMSAYTFKKMVVVNMLLNGNSYITIERANGKVTSLTLMISDNMQLIEKDGDIHYTNTITSKVYKKEDVIHILNYTTNGFKGISTLTYAFNSLEIAYDSDSHAGNFFKGGANLAGILRPIAGVNITKDKAVKAKADFVNSTATNVVGSVSNGIVVLDSGLEYQSISVNPADSQLLESRKFSVMDICRFFNTPPSMAFDQSGKYSTSEQEQLGFLQNTLQPIIEKIENEFFRKLYKPNEWLTTDIKFDIENLLRLDATTRASYYSTLYNMGALTTNEIREKTNARNPQVGGNRSFIAVNLQPLDALISEQPTVNPAAKVDNQVKQSSTTTEPVEPASGVTENIQGSALNGAQVTSLMQLLTSVSQGIISKATAKAAIQASFPAFTSEQINDMVDNIEIKLPPVL